MKKHTNKESEHIEALKEWKDPLKKDRWLEFLNLLREKKQLVCIWQIAIDYDQKPFESLRDLFSFEELEAITIGLVNNDLSRFPEIISFGKGDTILVHPDIAIKYVEILASRDEWFCKNVKIYT